MPPPVPDALSYDGTDVLPRSAMTPVEGKTKTGLGGVLSVAQRRWTRRLSDQTREYWDDEVKRTGRRARRLARDFGSDELVILDELQRQAVALQQLGRFREAETIIQDVCEQRSRQQGDGHQDTLNARLLHAGLLWQLGRLAEAESQCRQVAEAPTAAAYLGDAKVRSVRITHAGILAAFGRLPEAERLCLEIIGAMTPATDSDIRLALRARLAYADTLREL